MKFWVPEHRALALMILIAAIVVFLIMLISWVRHSAYYKVWKDGE